MRDVGVARGWVTKSGTFSFEKISPIPSIKPDVKATLTPREYAIYLMLYVDQMRNEMPDVADKYSDMLEAYRGAARKARLKDGRRAKRAQVAILNAFAAYDLPNSVVEDVRGNLQALASMKSVLHDGDDMPDDVECEDDDGEMSDSELIGELSAAVAVLRGEQDKIKATAVQRATQAAGDGHDAYLRGAMAAIDCMFGADVTSEHREKIIAQLPSDRQE